MGESKISEYIKTNPLAIKIAERTLNSALAKANVNLHGEAIAIIEDYFTAENPSWILTDEKPAFKLESPESRLIKITATLYDFVGGCYLYLNLLPMALEAYKIAAHGLVNSNVSALGIYAETRDYDNLIGLANHLKERYKDYPDEDFLNGVMSIVVIGALLRGDYKGAQSEFKLLYERVVDDQRWKDHLLSAFRDLSGKVPKEFLDEMIKAIRNG